MQPQTEDRGIRGMARSTYCGAETGSSSVAAGWRPLCQWTNLVNYIPGALPGRAHQPRSRSKDRAHGDQRVCCGRLHSGFSAPGLRQVWSGTHRRLVHKPGTVRHSIGTTSGQIRGPGTECIRHGSDSCVRQIRHGSSRSFRKRRPTRRRRCSMTGRNDGLNWFPGTWGLSTRRGSLLALSRMPSDLLGRAGPGLPTA